MISLVVATLAPLDQASAERTLGARFSAEERRTDSGKPTAAEERAQPRARPLGARVLEAGLGETRGEETGPNGTRRVQLETRELGRQAEEAQDGDRALRRDPLARPRLAIERRAEATQQRSIELEARVGELAQIEAERATARDRVARTVADAERQLAGATEQRRGLAREIDRLSDELEQAREVHKASKKEAKKAARSRDNAIARFFGLITETASSIGEFLALSSSAERLVDEQIDAQQQAATASKETVRVLGETIERKTAQLGAFDRALDAAQADLNAQREQLGALTRAAATAREATNEVRAEAGRVKTAAADLAGRVKDAIATYDDRIARLDQHQLAQRDAPRKARAEYRAALRRFGVSAAIEPKPGEVTQDAMAAAPERGVFAIADGVSSSDLPGSFARALVARFSERPVLEPERFGEILDAAQQAWSRETAPRRQSATTSTAWYAKRTAQKEWRAQSTFLGAQVDSEGSKLALKVIGVGDSVLFVVHDGKVKRAWPLSKSTQFSDSVSALASSDNKVQVKGARIAVQAGDEVFMMTDALGAWTATELEAGRDPFGVLRDLKNQTGLSAFVSSAREGKVRGRARLNEDDTTLLHFVVPRR